MLDLMLSMWIYALAATTLLLALVIAVQTTLRWVRGRRRATPATPVPAEPVTTTASERVSA